MDEEFNGLPRLAIPEIFYESETKQPIKSCKICDKALLDSGELYIAEKAYRRYPGFTATDTVFEYAICMDCAKKLSESYSKETLANFENYLEEKGNLFFRFMLMMQTGLPSADIAVERLGKCAVYGTTPEENEEYQVSSIFRGDNMLLTPVTMMLSGKAADDLQERVSAKTRDDLDDFIDNYLSGPPEFREIFKRDIILF
jgi:hypothetical protein